MLPPATLTDPSRFFLLGQSQGSVALHFHPVCPQPAAHVCAAGDPCFQTLAPPSLLPKPMVSTAPSSVRPQHNTARQRKHRWPVAGSGTAQAPGNRAFAGKPTHPCTPARVPTQHPARKARVWFLLSKPVPPLASKLDPKSAPRCWQPGCQTAQTITGVSFEQRRSDRNEGQD